MALVHSQIAAVLKPRVGNASSSTSAASQTISAMEAVTQSVTLGNNELVAKLDEQTALLKKISKSSGGSIIDDLIIGRILGNKLSAAMGIFHKSLTKGVSATFAKTSKLWNNGITRFISGLSTKLTKFIKMAGRPISSALSGLNRLLGVGNLTSTLGKMGSLFGKAARVVPKLLSKLALPITALLAIWEGVSGWMNADTILGKKTNIQEKVTASIGNVIDGLLLGIPSWLTGFLGFENFTVALDAGAKKTQKLISDAIISPISKAGDWIAEKFTGSMDWIKSKMPTLEEIIGTSVETVKTGFKNLIQTPVDKVTSFMSGIMDKMPSAAEFIDENWEDIRKSVVHFLTTPIRKIKEVMDGIGNKIENMKGGVEDWWHWVNTGEDRKATPAKSSSLGAGPSMSELKGFTGATSKTPTATVHKSSAVQTQGPGESTAINRKPMEAGNWLAEYFSSWVGGGMTAGLVSGDGSNKSSVEDKRERRATEERKEAQEERRHQESLEAMDMLLESLEGGKTRRRRRNYRGAADGPSPARNELVRQALADYMSGSATPGYSTPSTGTRSSYTGGSNNNPASLFNSDGSDVAAPSSDIPVGFASLPKSDQSALVKAKELDRQAKDIQATDPAKANKLRGEASKTRAGASQQARDYESGTVRGRAVDYSGKTTLTDRQNSVYQAFRKQGLSHGAAASFAAEIGRENDFRESLMFGKHTDPHNRVTNMGMMSWQGSRAKELSKFLGERGLLNKDGSIKRSQEAVDAQAAFAMHEMKNTEGDRGRRVYNTLMDPNSTHQQRAYALGKDFIRWRIDDPRYAHHKNKRDGYYNDIFGRSIPSGSGSTVAVGEPGYVPSPSEMNRQAALISTDSMLDSTKGLRIKAKGKTVTLDDLGVQGYGDLQSKGGQAFAGGYNDPAVVYALSKIQEGLGENFDRVTGVNDLYHHKYAPSSEHTKGFKADYTVKDGNYPKAHRDTSAILGQLGLVEGKDFKIISDPHGNGPHIDMKILETGREKLNQAKAMEVAALNESIQKQTTGTAVASADTEALAQVRRNIISKDLGLSNIKNRGVASSMAGGGSKITTPTGFSPVTFNAPVPSITDQRSSTPKNLGGAPTPPVREGAAPTYNVNDIPAIDEMKMLMWNSRMLS